MIRHKKPPVVILMNALDMGGAEKQSLLLARTLDSDYDVHYIVQKKKPQRRQHIDFINREGINYIQLSGNFFFRIFQLCSYLKKKKIEVLIGFLTLDVALASIVSVFRKIKYIGGVRNSYLPVIKFWATWLAQKYFLDYMVFNNHYARDLFITRGFSASKSCVIHNYINNVRDEIIRPKRDTIRILSVGRFTAQKDYLTALRAIELLNKRGMVKQIEYIIVGDGELLMKIKRWISNMSLGNVTMIVNPARVDDYYINSDIYLLSSIAEGMPNSIMEALNYSLPVVTTDVGDAKYLVEEGASGYLVKQGDPGSLADEIGILVHDYERRIAFGKYGHEMLIRDFSEERFRKQYNTLLENILRDQ